jgi:hypothetical protein
MAERQNIMHPRILRGCRRSLSMWREAIGRYREPRETPPPSERTRSADTLLSVDPDGHDHPCCADS